MKFTRPEFFKPFIQPVNRPVCSFTTLDTTENWNRHASRNCFWDCYRGRASQLLANFFPVPSNSPISPCEVSFFLTNHPFVLRCLNNGSWRTSVLKTEARLDNPYWICHLLVFQFLKGRKIHQLNL